MEGSPKTPHELFGIDVHKGWRPLVEPIIERIQELNEQGSAIEILQIKEKFGDLEFYVQNATQEICDMIKTAQKQAGHICEQCGKPAEKVVSTDRWCYTLCPDCLKGRGIDTIGTIEEFNGVLRDESKRYRKELMEGLRGKESGNKFVDHR